jgi:hypothetical protein
MVPLIISISDIELESTFLEQLPPEEGGRETWRSAGLPRGYCALVGAVQRGNMLKLG